MEYRQTDQFSDGYGDRPRRPPTTRSGVKGIIIVTIAVFVAQLVFGHSSFMQWLELQPEAVLKKGAVWQLVSYAFLHAPNDLMHILFNMLFLYWFGRAAEQIWGTRRFVIFYLGAAAFSGLCYVLWSYGAGRLIPCIGASGAVMACMMTYALWYPNQIILLFFIIPMRMRTFVIFTVCLEMYNLWNPKSGIANMAHLGGLLFGYVILRFGPRLRRMFFQEVSARADKVSADDDRRLDEILDKVHAKGINSLSWGERRFLKKMSGKR